MNSSLRDASTKAAKDIGTLGTELSLRKDVFGNVKAFAETNEAENLNVTTCGHILINEAV